MAQTRNGAKPQYGVLRLYFGHNKVIAPKRNYDYYGKVSLNFSAVNER